MKFTALQRQHQVPWFVCLDFEAKICKVPSVAAKPELPLPASQKRKFVWIVFPSEEIHVQSCKICTMTKPCDRIRQSTEKICNLTMFSFAYKIVSASGKHDYPLRICQAPNCGEQFLQSLKEDMTSLWSQLRSYYPITISEEQQREFELAEKCMLCQVRFSELKSSRSKHRDHDHLEPVSTSPSPPSPHYSIFFLLTGGGFVVFSFSSIIHLFSSSGG